MSDFTEEILKEKLARLTNHMESIQSTSNWLQKNHKNSDLIIRIWLKTIRKESTPARVINYLYLANDIAQNTRKSNPKFKDDYFPAIENAFRHVVRIKSSEIVKAVEKLIKVWKEREIYSSSQIKKLEEAILQKKLASSFPAPAVQNHVRNPPSQYIEEEVKKNAQDVLISLKRLQNPPSTEREIRIVLSKFPESISCPEKLNTVRTSEEAQKLLSKNEEALPLLEDYVKKLKEETREREQLQSMLDNFIQNVRLSVEHHEKLLKEVKKKEDRLKTDLLEVEKTFESLPDLTAELTMDTSTLPPLEKLFNLKQF